MQRVSPLLRLQSRAFGTLGATQSLHLNNLRYDPNELSSALRVSSFQQRREKLLASEVPILKYVSLCNQSDFGLKNIECVIKKMEDKDLKAAVTRLHNANFFAESMFPSCPWALSGPLKAAIEKDFGGVGGLAEAFFKNKGDYAWLVKTSSGLKVVHLSENQHPFTEGHGLPVMCCATADVNGSSFFDAVDWQEVSLRYNSKSARKWDAPNQLPLLTAKSPPRGKVGPNGVM